MKKQNNSPYVYSTNPDFKAPEEEIEEGEILPKNEQNVRVRLETKHRGGKAVTLVEQMQATESERENIGKQLKNFCGTGGSVKDGEILIQGDQRDKVLQWLLKNGYSKAKKSG